MPLMKSLRTFTLSTTLGHTVGFEGGVPAYVAPAAVPAAMAAGCVMVDEADTPFYEDLGHAKVEFVGDLRASIIYLAIQAVAAKNDPKEFDGSNYPKASVISDMLGFDTIPAEVAPIYQQYLNLKQDGKEYPLAPEALSVRRVMEADSKADLLLLAEEFDVDRAKAKGLVAKELRKLLMVKLSGVAVG